MSELTVAALRLGLFALMWLFVFLVVAVLRADLFSTRPARNRESRRGSSRSRAADLAPSQPAPVAVPAARQQRRSGPPPSVLVVSAGALRGTVVALGSSPITIGRAPDSTLVLDDDFASSRHARIVPHGSEWWAEDLGSTNGTLLAGQRISSPARLDVGVPLTIGHTVMELQP